MFSSSKSSSKSYAYDNRSLASDQAIAAGGSDGSYVQYRPGEKNFYPGGVKVAWKPVLIAGVAAFVLWKIPATKKIIRKIVRFR